VGSSLRRLAAVTLLVAAALCVLPAAGPAGALPVTHPVVGMARTPGGGGYWVVTDDGAVFAFGDARYLGSVPASTAAGRVVAIAGAPRGLGYWLMTSTGRVFAFGDARGHGSAAVPGNAGAVVALAPSPDGRGYWVATSSGRVFAFGDAPDLRPSPAAGRAGGVIGMAVAAGGRGYWLVTAEGRVFGAGTARALGPAPAGSGTVVGIAASPRGPGYWLATSSGGVYAYGRAKYRGSITAPGSQAVIGVVATQGGLGYWLVGADGSVLPYGDAPDEGAVTALAPAGPPRIAVYGDSQAAEASPALELLASRDGAAIRVVAFGGLAICNDLATMAADAASWRPTAVIIDFSGDNFTRCMDGDPLGSPQYYAKYGADARTAIATFRPEGARMVLVGAPVDESSSLTGNVAALNQVYATAAAGQPGVTYVDAGTAVEQAGAFTFTLPCLADEPCTGPNHTNVVRSPDGVHFCPTGQTRLEANAEVCDVYSSGALRFAGAMLAPALTAPAPPSPRRASPRRRR
jgi:hypothetical protein